jgi:hypothetical protein
VSVGKEDPSTVRRECSALAVRAPVSGSFVRQGARSGHGRVLSATATRCSRRSPIERVPRVASTFQGASSVSRKAAWRQEFRPQPAARGTSVGCFNSRPATTVDAGERRSSRDNSSPTHSSPCHLRWWICWPSISGMMSVTPRAVRWKRRLSSSGSSPTTNPSGSWQCLSTTVRLSTT